MEGGNAKSKRGWISLKLQSLSVEHNDKLPDISTSHFNITIHPANKIENNALCDAVHRFYQSITYFQNVLQFYGQEHADLLFQISHELNNKRKVQTEELL